ncbi:CHAD domain-containing protein [Chitinophaga sp. YIM B06452]|uniref:CHAD domain-containing protein n=1 Tax=Chitinophaga sp. YIM B06452 TaxID=3082158 RepID=UPI0031FE90C3
MLKRKKQQKYLVKRCLEIRRQLRAFADSGSQEALHKLRVEIKKIRAFEKFAVPGKENAKRMKTIREIFHRAGIIREANINLQMMKQYHINHPAFSTEATQTLRQESEQFRLHAAGYDQYIRNTVSALLRATRPVRNRDIRHWAARQLKKIAAGVTALSTDQLHEARKSIKNLLYVHGILPERLVERLNLNIPYLDQLQDDIGKWHDTALAVDLLASGGAGNKTKIIKLKKEQDKMSDAVHAASDGFWDKAVQPSP